MRMRGNSTVTVKLSNNDDFFMANSSLSLKVLALDGDDEIRTFATNDTLDGGDGNDILDAGDGDNLIIGGKGDDRLMSGIGNDTLKGDAGMDLLESWGGMDLFYGGGGTDFLYYGSWGSLLTSDQVIMHGGADNDVLVAWGGSSVRMYGDSGNDSLVDYSGTATLYGGDGDDSLIGTGNDMIISGRGADRIGIMGDSAHGELPVQVEVIDFDFRPGTPGMSDTIDLSNLVMWGESGSYPYFTADDIEIRGDSMFIPNATGGEHEIIGVGEEIALIGVMSAIDLGLIYMPMMSLKG